MEARFFEDEDLLYLAGCGCVLVAAFGAPATPARLRRLGDAQARVVAAHGKIITLIVADPTVGKALSPEAQAVAKEIQRRDEHASVAVGWLMAGSPIFMALAKSIISGVQWAFKPKAPWRLFHMDDVDALVPWLAQTARDAGLPADEAALFGAVQAALAARLAWDPEVRSRENPTQAGPLAAPTLPAKLGKYTLQKRLGLGGMAEAFLATAEGAGGFEKTLVVKRMLPHLAEERQFVEMFLREARMAASLNHTNLVQVFDAGTVGGVHFIAMEYVDGENLHQLMRRAEHAHVDVPLPAILTIIADAARGLDHAHNRTGPDGLPAALVHRDVSPDNLMVAADGTTKVLDFGVARAADGPSVTATGVVKGKVPYMSPEQLAAAPLDGRADLYALGVVLYWALAGRRPFTSKNELELIQKITRDAPPPLSSLGVQVSPALEAVVSQLLEKDRSKRPESGRELARQLEALGGNSRDAVAALIARVRAAAPPMAEGAAYGPADDDTSESRAVTALQGQLPPTPPTGSTSTAATLVVAPRPSRRPVLIAAAVGALIGALVLAALAMLRG